MRLNYVLKNRYPKFDSRNKTKLRNKTKFYLISIKTKQKDL